MIRNEKCEVLDKQNFEPKYRMVYDTRNLIKPTRLEEITSRIILEKVLKCKNERKAGNKHPLSTPTAECK